MQQADKIMSGAYTLVYNIFIIFKNFKQGLIFVLLV